MKIKEQTPQPQNTVLRLWIGFEVVDETDDCFEVVDRTDEAVTYTTDRMKLTWFEEIFEEYNLIKFVNIMSLL
ncbi:chlorohydrolase [Streptococcus pneumoniae]|nr:chlorohydrolase [Streptococcus pneumoniae]